MHLDLADDYMFNNDNANMLYLWEQVNMTGTAHGLAQVAAFRVLAREGPATGNERELKVNANPIIIELYARHNDAQTRYENWINRFRAINGEGAEPSSTELTVGIEGV